MENIIKLINGSFLLYSGKYDFDNEIYPFQVNNNFFYLTGLEIPNVVILYNNITNKFTYFFEYKDPVWFDNFSFIDQIDSQVLDIKDIEKYIIGIKKLYSLNNFENLALELNIEYDTFSIDNICDQYRIIKNKKEIENISKACSISSNAIINIIKNRCNFNNEQEIVSYFKKQILNNNIEKMAYLPICSNGEQNSVLHYVFNKKHIPEYPQRNLVLLDIGCKYNNYCSDITRTFPTSTKFTNTQKKIYEIVLECQKYSIQMLKNGTDWENLKFLNRIKMYDLLLEIKLVYKTDSEKDKIDVTNHFMPHGLGHTVGLDVHDTNPEGGLKILKKNMIITIEPGIYFIDHLLNSNKLINIKEVEKYKKIGGIRIEDTILINQNDCTVLSNIPKEINDIEKLL
jgi:Xaa-Pro dipeptidase